MSTSGQFQHVEGHACYGQKKTVCMTARTATDDKPVKLSDGKEVRAMTFEISVINLRPSSSTSSVRAYADVRLNSDAGSVKILGLSIVETAGKSPWVAFPQKPGKNAKKYFPVVEAEGKLKELIVNAVLDAYGSSKN